MLRSIVIGIAAALATASPAMAQGFVEGVRAGILAQGCCGPAQDKEQGIAINGEVVFSSPRILSVLLSPRPVVGLNVASDSDATNQLYAGFDWRFDLPARTFLSVGAGGVVHDGETDTYDPLVDSDRLTNTNFFGCRAQFRLSGDVGLRLTSRLDLMAHWSHMSNAGICGDNEGLDHLGVRVGLRF